MPHDGFEIGVPRLPAELALRALARRAQLGRVALAARRRLPGDRPSDHAAHRVDHALHRVCRPSADIVRCRRGAAFERRERPQVRIRQVADVNVVPQAGSVGRRIVLAEHLQRRAAVGRPNRQRDEMDLGIVVFADLAARVRTGRVEIAQGDPPQSVRALEMRQRPLDRELGFAVRVGRMLFEGLDNRHRRRLAIDRAGRRKDESTNAGQAHGVEHRERSGDVVVVVLERPVHRLVHDEPGGKVHHRVGLMLLERASNLVGIVDVRPRERDAGGNGFGVPLADRSSTTATACPASTRARTAWLPTYPAPPVTTTRANAISRWRST